MRVMLARLAWRRPVEASNAGLRLYIWPYIKSRLTYTGRFPPNTENNMESMGQLSNCSKS